MILFYFNFKQKIKEIKTTYKLLLQNPKSQLFNYKYSTNLWKNDILKRVSPKIEIE